MKNYNVCLLFFFPTAVPNHCLKCGQKDVGFVRISQRVYCRKCFLKKKKKLLSASVKHFHFRTRAQGSPLSQDNTFYEAVLLPFSKITPPCKPVSASTEPGF